MVYTAKAFFDLQWQFADKVAAISGLPLPRVLFEYTNLYIRFGCGRDFQPTHPVWQAYLAGLQDTDDKRAWTYRFYLTRDEAMAGPPVAATFGCFSYALLPGDRIRLHFQNTNTTGHSSLGAACVGQRCADLCALFGHIQRTFPSRVQVVGIFMALQSRGVSSPLSGRVHRDGARAQGSLSLHATLGAIPRSAWRAQRTDDASFFSASGATNVCRAFARMLSIASAHRGSAGAGVLCVLWPLAILPQAGHKAARGGGETTRIGVPSLGCPCTTMRRMVASGMAQLA